MRAEGPRVVLDTNVWLSAWLSRQGTAAAAVRWSLNHARIHFSAATFAELESRCWKPKFDRYFSLEQRRLLLHDTKGVAHWVEPDEATQAIRASRDADDDPFLHLALAAEADWLVTGDADLLVLEAVGGCSILSPGDFLQAVGAV